MRIKKYKLENLSHIEFKLIMLKGSCFICKTTIMALSEQIYQLMEKRLRDESTVKRVK
jgi:Fe-S cluster biogenesis protein NfuA